MKSSTVVNYLKRGTIKNLIVALKYDHHFPLLTRKITNFLAKQHFDIKFQFLVRFIEIFMCDYICDYIQMYLQ